jgi:hypothetical protein
MAFNLLSILLMSAECERVFSFTKRFIFSNRNRLKDDVIEAMSCLNIGIRQIMQRRPRMSSSHIAAWVHILLCECAYYGLVTFEHLINQIK